MHPERINSPRIERGGGIVLAAPFTFASVLMLPVVLVLGGFRLASLPTDMGVSVTIDDVAKEKMDY